MKICIRKFGTPDIRFESEVYVDFIDWMDGSTLEPPLSGEEQSAFTAENETYKRYRHIFNLPCQSVEQCFKVVTAAS